MRVSGNLVADLDQVAGRIREYEAQGYDACYSAEINNDPFFPLLLAAEHSARIQLSTAISVAFARNPMTLANLAWDLNQYSHGRFALGLGSQIQAHITRRFSMPWSAPVARMREFIQAMQAIWRCWSTGEKLDFRGEHYQHTLMTPVFVPAKREYGAPLVRLAAVGPAMTELAAEVADGVVAHGFTTERYLAEVTVPAIERGLKKAGRARAEFDISAPAMVVSGDNEQQFLQNRETIRSQIAFYASTPAYTAVLALHGWESLQPELNQLSKQGRWVDMAGLITDDIVETFAVIAEAPEQIPTALAARHGRYLDTWMCTYNSADADRQRALIRAVQQTTPLSGNA